MSRGQRSLRDPPEAFKAAMSLLHQDALVIHPTLDAVADEAAAGTRDAGGLLTFLDAILDDEQVVNADLRALIHRQPFVSIGINSKMARQFLERIRETLRQRLQAHA